MVSSYDPQPAWKWNGSILEGVVKAGRKRRRQ